MSKKNQKTQSSAYSSIDIVTDVEQQLKTSTDLYERYIESNALFIIDPVTNSEFLKNGWSENIIHNDTVVKEVEDEFSFVINLKVAEEIIITAALKGDDLYLKPVQLFFFEGKKVIGSIDLRYNHFSKYTFSVPKQYRKEHTIITGKLKKTKASSRVVIRSITAVKSKILTDYLHETLFELEKIKRDSSQLLQFLEWHKNPELLLPGNPNKSFLKKAVKKVGKPFLNRFSNSLLIKRVVLKLIRPFTTPQIMFNQYLLEVINLQEKRNNKLEELLLSTMKIPNKKKHEKNSSVR